MFMGVTQADGPHLEPLCLRQVTRTARQAQHGLTARSVDDLDLLPRHLTDPGSQRLRHGLLGSEARRQSGRRAGGVDQLLLSEEAVEETVAVPQDRPIDPIDLGHVHTRADHAGPPLNAGPAMAIANRSGERNRRACCRMSSRVMAATRSGYPR